MLRKKLLTLAAAGLALGLTTPAMATIGTVGAFVGPSFVNNNVGTEVLFGVDATYKFMPSINIGARVGYESQTPSGFPYSLGLWLLLAQANYTFDGMIDGLHAGGQAGLGISTNSAPLASSSTNFVFGPSAGYDYPLGMGLSVGLDLSLLFATSNPSATLFNVLGIVNYGL